MFKFWLFVVNFVTGLVLAIMLVRDRLRDDTYVTKVVIDRPFDEVWQWLADPGRYTTLAPGWISDVTPLADDRYNVRLPGRSSPETMLVQSDRAAGTIDLHFETEHCHARVVAIDPERTAVMFFTKRWERCGVVSWVRYKWTVSRDLEHAKKVFESAPRELAMTGH